jgi:drug/metabolite transporter (DMT)-like permease
VTKKGWLLFAAMCVIWGIRVLASLASLAALGVVCTAFAFLVFLELTREVGPSRAMVFTYINPAVAVAAGVALLGERFTAAIGISFALILAGCFLATSARGPVRVVPKADLTKA